MKIFNFRNHPFVLPIVGFLLLFFGAAVLFVGLGGTTVGAGSSRIVEVFLDGQQQIVPTRATTVADLLERLDITVDDKDIVEPALNTAITDDDFSVNIYKARSVMVVDEGRKRVVETAEPTARGIAEAADLEVHPEDVIERVPVDLSNPTEALQNGLVAQKVTIDRATPISLSLYGNAVPVRTHAETVGELLEEKNVKLNEGDTLEPAASTRLGKDTRIFIVRHGNKVETKEEVIPIPVETISDPALTAGTRRVQEPGAVGRKVVTYEVELRNGQEVARRVLQEVIATPPIKQVVIIGTQPIAGGNGALLLQLRTCETGGNYQTNTGNGYYGAYQFSEATWNSMGTGVARADLAPPPVQDDAALRLARRSGFHSQFPGCSFKLSLPPYPY